MASGSRASPRVVVYGTLVFIVAVVAAVAISLYANVAPRARIAEAQADLRILQAGLQAYVDHCGGLPPAGEPETSDCPKARRTARTSSARKGTGPW